MDLSTHTKARLGAISRSIEFDRARDQMGQFAPGQETNPEVMRKAYTKPLRERLRHFRKKH